MKRLSLGAVVLLLSALTVLYAWLRLRSEMGEAVAVREVLVEGPEKHTVTPQMAAASSLMLNQPAPLFDRVDSNNQPCSLTNLCKKGPTVLTFVRDGCPCSEAAQPFFNQVAKAYPTANFLAVIDTDNEMANAWASRFKVPYPMLPVPDQQVMKDYRAENSAYVVVIDTQGQIRKHWPGYSAQMLEELNQELARLTARKAPNLNFVDAPEELYSGCPF